MSESGLNNVQKTHFEGLFIKDVITRDSGGEGGGIGQKITNEDMMTGCVCV